MKTCLVVDDSKVVRILARRILEELNFDVSEAADGKAAVDVCQQTMPDAVLLDWNMPIMSGIEFLKELRQMKGGDSPISLFFAPRKTTWTTSRKPSPAARTSMS